MEREYTITSSKDVMLTTQFAEKYLQLPNLPGERPINEHHVATLQAKFESGEILPETITIATVEIDGTTYKLNGQHTCKARLEFNGSHNIKVRHLHYTAKDFEEAARLYNQYDPACSTRTFNHRSTIYWNSVGLFDRANKKIIELAACALAFDKGGRTEYGRMAIKGDSRIKLPSYEPQLVAQLQEIIVNRTAGGHMMREPVAAAIVQTIRINASAAKRFWSAVRDGEMLRKESPEKRLRDYLTNTSYNVGKGGSASPSRKAGFHEIYSKCIHAWNAYRDGRTTDLKCYANAALPVAK